MTASTFTYADVLMSFSPECSSAFQKQEGGSHYKNYKIQPLEYAIANNLSFPQGCVIKYVTRYKDKGGAEDIRKAIHFLEMILEYEYSAAASR